MDLNDRSVGKTLVLNKHEDPSSSPRTHRDGLGVTVCTYGLLTKPRQTYCYGSLANQSSQLSEHKANERASFKKKKKQQQQGDF